MQIMVLCFLYSSRGWEAGSVSKIRGLFAGALTRNSKQSGRSECGWQCQSISFARHEFVANDWVMVSLKGGVR
jgi:hypothetical protein